MDTVLRIDDVKTNNLIRICISYSGKKLIAEGTIYDIVKETPKFIELTRENYDNRRVKKEELGVISRRMFGNSIADFSFVCWCRKADFEKCKAETKQKFLDFLTDTEQHLSTVRTEVSKLKWK